jgi:hypothetical protein
VTNQRHSGPLIQKRHKPAIEGAAASGALTHCFSDLPREQARDAKAPSLPFVISPIRALAEGANYDVPEFSIRNLAKTDVELSRRCGGVWFCPRAESMD